MGYIQQSDNKKIYAYLTQTGKEKVLVGDISDFEIKYFSLHDDDINYKVSSKIYSTSYNTLKSGFVPDITGDDNICLPNISNATFLEKNQLITTEIVEPPIIITYQITPNVTIINEGQSVIFTITTTNVADGTILNWSNVGTSNSSDFAENINNGTVTINGNSGTITLTSINTDSTSEGNETIKINLINQSSGNILATSQEVTIADTLAIVYAITSDKLNITETESVIFTITTQNVPDNTILNWTNIGTTNSTDFTQNVNNGTVTINSNTANFTLTPKEDIIAESPETIKIRLTNQSGNVLATSQDVTVTDQPAKFSFKLGIENGLPSLNRQQNSPTILMRRSSEGYRENYVGANFEYKFYFIQPETVGGPFGSNSYYPTSSPGGYQGDYFQPFISKDINIEVVDNNKNIVINNTADWKYEIFLHTNHIFFTNDSNSTAFNNILQTIRNSDLTNPDNSVYWNYKISFSTNNSFNLIVTPDSLNPNLLKANFANKIWTASFNTSNFYFKEITDKIIYNLCVAGNGCSIFSFGSGGFGSTARYNVAQGYRYCKLRITNQKAKELYPNTNYFSEQYFWLNVRISNG